MSSQGTQQSKYLYTEWTSGCLALGPEPHRLPSLQIGLLTTMAILLHEIPHEVRARGFPWRQCGRGASERDLGWEAQQCQPWGLGFGGLERLCPPGCSHLLRCAPASRGEGECGLGASSRAGAGGSVCRSVPDRLGPRVIIWTSPQVGDFAILLRAGFDRWSAAKLQLSTALGGLLGACFAICTQSPKGVGTGVVGGGGRWWSAEGPQPEGTAAPPRCPGQDLPKAYPVGEGAVHTAALASHPVGTSPPTAEETVAWILPFTSGGFLYIALVNVLPDLLEEDDPW